MLTQKLNYKLIQECRLCYSKDLQTILDLGLMSSCGRFLNDTNSTDLVGELKLLFCHHCTLVQLDRNFLLSELFGKDYGYETSLNSSMKSHIEDVATDSLFYFKDSENINVMDIGSNDATLLKFINDCKKCNLVGVDPNIQDFSNKYDSRIAQFSNFFNEETVNKINKRFPEGFDLIFSLAMLYDVPDLNSFANLIGKILKKNGIWIIEVSYLFNMLEKNSIDTICHEHISYFSLNALKFMAKQNQLKVVDFELNDTNGGSVKIILSHKDSDYLECKKFEDETIKELAKIHTLPRLFELMVQDLKLNIELALNFLSNLEQDAKIIAIGASTKGNTFLQIAKELSRKIQYIMEINPKKFDKLTPGTYIPIISEEFVFKTREKLWAIVLPWHFKSNISDKFSQLILDDHLELLYIIPKFKSVNSKNYHTS